MEIALMWIGLGVAAFGIIVSMMAVGERTRVCKMTLVWATVSLALYALHYEFYGLDGSDTYFRESLVRLGASVVLIGVWHFFASDNS